MKSAWKRGQVNAEEDFLPCFVPDGAVELCVGNPGEMQSVPNKPNSV